MKGRQNKRNRIFNVEVSKADIWNDPEAYAEAVRIWSESLHPTDLAALAYEYRHGNHDPACADAQAELERRRGPRQIANNPRRCDMHQGKRGSVGGCPDCSEKRAALDDIDALPAAAHAVAI